MGSGKDTAGKYIVKRLSEKGRSIARYAFADHLKNQLAETLNWSLSELELRKNTRMIRRMMQEYGEEMRTEVHKDYWMIQVIAKIVQDDLDFAVITDVRYHNEAEWVNCHGSLFRIIRPAAAAVNPSYNSHHVSEKTQQEFRVDHELINDGIPDKLYTHIDAALTSFRYL